LAVLVDVGMLQRVQKRVGERELIGSSTSSVGSDTPTPIRPWTRSGGQALPTMLAADRRSWSMMLALLLEEFGSLS
jgi:hypothetical protein